MAAKKYKDGHFHRKSNIDLFCREVSIHSKLEHPHILKFLGAVVDDPARFCILTEFIPGGSLYEVLHLRRTSMDFRTRIATAAGVASGMECVSMLGLFFWVFWFGGRGLGHLRLFLVLYSCWPSRLH